MIWYGKNVRHTTKEIGVLFNKPVRFYVNSMKYLGKSSESFGRLRSNSETIAAKIKPTFCLEMGSKCGCHDGRHLGSRHEFCRVIAHDKRLIW